MAKLGKFILYMLFFFVSIVVLFPKVNAYYLLEEYLQKEKIVFSQEKVSEHNFGLQITNTHLSYESIEVADIQSIQLKIFGFYNKLVIHDVKINSIASGWFPATIKEVDIAYSVINPLKISGFVKGEFGNAKLTFSLLELKLIVTMQVSKKMLTTYAKTLRKMKKEKNGAYSYEQIIKF